MPRPHAMLRGLMTQRGIEQSHIAQLIGLTEKTAVSHRMTGKTTWRLDEVYAIADYFQIPYEQIHVYFPKQTKDVKKCNIKRTSIKTANT